MNFQYVEKAREAENAWPKDLWCKVRIQCFQSVCWASCTIFTGKTTRRKQCYNETTVQRLHAASKQGITLICARHLPCIQSETYFRCFSRKYSVFEVSAIELKQWKEYELEMPEQRALSALLLMAQVTLDTGNCSGSIMEQTSKGIWSDEHDDGSKYLVSRFLSRIVNLYERLSSVVGYALTNGQNAISVSNWKGNCLFLWKEIYGCWRRQKDRLQE